MSWRDRIARQLMAARGLTEGPVRSPPTPLMRSLDPPPLPSAPAWSGSSGRFDSPPAALQPQAEAAGALSSRGFDPLAAEQRIRQRIAGEGEWAAKVREGEIKDVVKGNYGMWHPADPVADTAHVGPRIQEYNDALRFLQNSTPINPYGVR